MICFFGDSIFNGQGVAPHKTFVGRLSQRANELVQNASRNGDTTRLALERMPHDVQAHRPSTLIVQFGINDSNCWDTDGGLPRVSLAAFRANLIEIARRGRTFGAERVVFLTNHPSEKSDEHRDACFRYSEAIRGVAEMQCAELVDIEALWLERGKGTAHLQADGVHLTHAGHSFYLSVLEPVLLPPPCPKCDGTGEIRFMNMHPEDYTPPVPCECAA